MRQRLLYPPLTAGHTEAHIPPVSLIGGKAVGLYWLAVHGLPTPPTWVLNTSLFNVAIQKSGERQKIIRLWDSMQALEGDWKTVHHRLQEIEPELTNIREALQNITQFDMAAEALAELPATKHEYWAVRSSATVEDNPNYSFAGQFHTKISVLRHAIWGTIREVWASVFTREVFSYCFYHRTALPRMGVVLQPMRPVTAGDRAGVMFSHSPLPMLKGVIIQATFGTGKTVVAGRGGDIYNVNGDNVAIQPMPPDRIEVSGPEGELRSMTPPNRPPLTEGEARTLANLTRRIAKQWGDSVDIEFIWKANSPEPELVQVRSATGRD